MEARALLYSTRYRILVQARIYDAIPRVTTLQLATRATASAPPSELIAHGPPHGPPARLAPRVHFTRQAIRGARAADRACVRGSRARRGHSRGHTIGHTIEMLARGRSAHGHDGGGKGKASCLTSRSTPATSAHSAPACAARSAAPPWAHARPPSSTDSACSQRRHCRARRCRRPTRMPRRGSGGC